LLRRGGTEVLAVNGVRINGESRRAWLSDDELTLTAKEFDLLHALMLGAGKVVTRDQLMHEVWDASRGTSSKTLDMHVSWLRRKLGDDASSPRLITTVRGLGFRFELG
jgi:DNA-binding response OmpR family regulator